MKALIFNHHPDYIWYLQKTLEYLNIECFIATEELTFKYGANYCSVSNDYKLRTGPKWYSEEELFGSKIFKYSNDISGFDYIFSMNRDIVNQIHFNDHNKLFFIACVSWDLEGMNDSSQYIKITSHHNAGLFNAHYVPYFVPQTGNLQNKIYITQLIEGYKNSIYYNELLNLKQNNHPVIIAGAEDAPDGIVNDWETLSNTSLLVHHKDYGTNCNSVMKALDTGVPIYISRENKEKTGMADLPDELFLYSNDMSIYEAYKKSLTINNNEIQNVFRKIRNVENTSKYLKSIL